MEDVGAQVASPILLHRALSSPFCDVHPMAKKRALPYQSANFHQPLPHQRFQNPGDEWNPKSWDWDSVRFLSKPLDADLLRLGTVLATDPIQKRELENKALGEENESLCLNLGGVGLKLSSDEAVSNSSKPNKRVRSGSPGGTNYPICQVDNCKEDLSNAKDYHRRHKVCEIHSKSTKAIVANQMQRFCQQCSRFHLLSEFDEGKRSCRRRLAGHNRRRRKTQPDDVTSSLVLSGNQNNLSSGHLNIINLLTAIAHAQGKDEDENVNTSSSDQLVQILSKINSLPLPMDLAEKIPNPPEKTYSQHQNRSNGNSSTMDLLAVLSGTLAAPAPAPAPAPNALAVISQNSSQSSDSQKSKSTCIDRAAAGPDLPKRPLEFPSFGGESSSSYQSPMEDSGGQALETLINLPLQLFLSSPEDDIRPKVASSRKLFSSSSSNPIEDRSPTSSPPFVQNLFPMHSTTKATEIEEMSNKGEINVNIDDRSRPGCNTPLELLRGSSKGADPGSSQSIQYHRGYNSSGSDHSSLNSDAQDRTGQIIFKLFDKDPSHFPGALRTQIYNWLSNSPSEMESYIRPGCVVLSVYVSMPAAAWNQLEEDLLQKVNSLVQNSDSQFWTSGRFLVSIGRQLALHKDGKIRLCKSWRTWNSPELISVSPLAVVGGQETSFLLRGRNLTNPGTKIHCTYVGGYISKEVKQSSHRGTLLDEIDIGSFKIDDASPSILGRCFIEVENGFKGSSFPVIIADAAICKELRLLESEFDAEANIPVVVSEGCINDSGKPRSREEILHFLNELGWLFQRKRTDFMLEGPEYSLSRFKFLLIFSVEKDCCALVKVLLDMLVDRTLVGNRLSKELLETLSAIHLLSRAVKRRCIKMVDLLLHYHVIISNDTDKKYIFLPNVAGPVGFAPLHLAASTAGSYDVIDALTNDPQEIGLQCWNYLLDANGQSPYAYAMMCNNHSYNQLVAQKLANRRNGQLSVTISNESEQPRLPIEQELRTNPKLAQGHRSCAKCAVVAAKYNKRIRGSQGLLQWPHVHTMLAVAAVCVCVCLFLRGAPDIGLVAPFKWENLGYGTR